MSTIVIRSGKVFIAECPEIPNEKDHFFVDQGESEPYSNALAEYQKALAQSLLPENIIEIQDQKQIKLLLNDTHPNLEGENIPDGEYPLPSGWLVKIGYQCKDDWKWNTCAEWVYESRKKANLPTRKLARLVRVPDKGEKPSGGGGIWYCEKHPEYEMGHNGCTGAGVVEAARGFHFELQRRNASQQLKETKSYLNSLILNLSERVKELESSNDLKAKAIIGMLKAFEYDGQTEGENNACYQARESIKDKLSEGEKKEEPTNEAIEFAKWIAAMEPGVTLTDNVWFFEGVENGDEPISTEELFDLYTECQRNAKQFNSQ